MWCVRAACHHAEAVRDEEEVGDRDGVAIGLEHTLFIWGVCVWYTWVRLYVMHMVCIWYACEMHTVHSDEALYSTLVYMYMWLYLEEVLLPALGPHRARDIVCRPPRLQHFGVAGSGVAWQVVAHLPRPYEVNPVN